MLKIAGILGLVVFLIYSARPFAKKNVLALIFDLVLVLSVFFVTEHLYLLFIVDMLFLVWLCRNYNNGEIHIRILSLVWFTGTFLIMTNIFFQTVGVSILVGFFLKVVSPFIFRSNIKVLRDGYLRLSIPTMWLSSHYSETAQHVPAILLILLSVFVVWVLINGVNRLDSETVAINSAILFSTVFLIVSMEHRSFSDMALLSFIVISAALFFCDLEYGDILTFLLLIPLPPFPFYFFEMRLVSTKCHYYILLTSIIFAIFVSVISVFNINKRLKNKRISWI